MDDYLDSPMEEDVFPCKGCGEVCAPRRMDVAIVTDFDP